VIYSTNIIKSTACEEFWGRAKTSLSRCAEPKMGRIEIEEMQISEREERRGSMTLTSK
jgi:hypothetical protein